MPDPHRKCSPDFRKVIVSAFLAILLLVLMYAYGVVASLGQRRHDHETLFKKQSQMMYYLASKGDFNGIGKLGFGSQKNFEEMDRKFGTVQSWSVNRVHVRFLGLPGYVVVKVKRDSEQLELLTFMSRGSGTAEVVTEEQLRTYGFPNEGGS